MAEVNWRTINIDALDPDSPANFDISSLIPAQPPVSASEIQSVAQQCRQLLRGGDAEGALTGALQMAPYGGDAAVKVSMLKTMIFPRAWSLTIVRLLGNPSSHRRRDLAGHQASRYDADVKENV